MPSPLKEPIPETTLAVAEARKQWLLVWLGYAFAVLLITRASWLSDDAYIGFRAIDNLLQGYGPNYNIGERVQVYTYPLWFYIQSMFAVLSGGEYMITMQGLSILTASVAVWVVLRYLCLGPAAGFLALACMVSSKSFMDYTTSGLENPLSYLLAGLFCHLALNRGRTFAQWRLLVLVATLAVLTRQDTALIYFPLLAYRLWMHLKRREATLLQAIGAALLFSLPLWLWLGFSVAYYGYPFPNTYYAKLYTGVPSGSLLFQGLMYYLSTLQRDGLTLIVLLGGLASAILSRKEDRIMLAVGVVVYLLYIIKIGGDFMLGRFFSVPFVISLILAARFELEGRYKLALGAVAVLLGLSMPRPTLYYGNDGPVTMEEAVDVRGIANERGYYYPATGLMPQVARAHGTPAQEWWHDGYAARKAGVKYVELISIGYYGVAAGPSVHMVDLAGLGDPLLSRLPIPYDSENPESWRIGHFIRLVPDGYRESILSNQNLLKDPVLKPVYGSVRLITRGPIWSSERWSEIWKMNTGHYDAAIKNWEGGDLKRWQQTHNGPLPQLH